MARPMLMVGLVETTTMNGLNDYARLRRRLLAGLFALQAVAVAIGALAN